MDHTPNLEGAFKLFGEAGICRECVERGTDDNPLTLVIASVNGEKVGIYIHQSHLNDSWTQPGLSFGKDKSTPQDNGTREQFGNGATRESLDTKVLFHLITPFGLMRLGAWYTGGAKKYGPRNWEKGLPLSSYLRAILSHAFKIMLGDKSEDHWAAIAWNAMGGIDTEEKVGLKLLDSDLLDLPDYLQRNKKSYRAFLEKYG